MKRGYQCGFLLLLLASSSALSADIMISDQRTGITCNDYQASLNLAWQNRGGDWLDLEGKKQGTEPYYVNAVNRSRNRQVVDWDISNLARAWSRGTGTAGGIYLKQLASQKSSVVFHSREAKDVDSRPRLLLKWKNHGEEILSPYADTMINCSNSSGNGHRRTIQVGNGRSSIIVFPFRPRPNDELISAVLTLTSDKQHQGQSRIGLFNLSIPTQEDSQQKPGLADAYKLDKNIGSNPYVVFTEDFENDKWLENWSSLSQSSTVRRVNKSGENGFIPFSGHALEVTIPRHKKQGVNLLYRFQQKTGSEPDEMFFRYYLRFGEDWNPRTGGKMPGFAGTYGRAGWGGRMPDGTDGWSARGNYAVSSTLADGSISLGSYVYHAALTKKYGDNWGWNLGPTGIVRKNAWYSVEQYIKLNDPGKKNGVMQAWIDGVPVFSRRNLSFREVANLHIETLWVNVYHGGTSSAPQNIRMYIDNLVIAKKYIGPAGTNPEGGER